MIRLETFLKIFNVWITLYSYWLINLFVIAYAKKNKSPDFFILLASLFYGAILGVTICVTMDWFDLYLNFAPSINTSEISSLSMNDNLILDDLNVKKQEELEVQKEVEDLRRQNYIWIITTLVVYYIVFSNI